MDKELKEEVFFNVDCIPFMEEPENGKKYSNIIENEHMKKLVNKTSHNDNFLTALEEFEFDLSKNGNKNTKSIILESSISSNRNKSKSSTKKEEIKLIATFNRKKKFRIKFKK